MCKQFCYLNINFLWHCFMMQFPNKVIIPLCGDTLTNKNVRYEYYSNISLTWNQSYIISWFKSKEMNFDLTYRWCKFNELEFHLCIDKKLNVMRHDQRHDFFSLLQVQTSKELLSLGNDVLQVKYSSRLHFIVIFANKILSIENSRGTKCLNLALFDQISRQKTLHNSLIAI